MALAATTPDATATVFGFGTIRDTKPALHVSGSPTIEPGAVGASGPSDFGVSVIEPSRETIRQLAPFSSLFDIVWDHPELNELVSYTQSYDMKVLISLHRLFFAIESIAGESRPRWILRQDYAARWQEFVLLHREVLGFGTVWAFYLADEPFWNGISVSDLTTASDTVKQTFPLIPTMASMNRHDIDSTPHHLPPELFDVVGYHAYAVPEDPNFDPEYQHYLRLFQERYSGRSFMIVADAWWSEDRHGASGLEPATLAARASQYREVAESIGAVAVGAFVWETFSGGIGLRELPEEVVREYMRIGAEITGRCGVPDAIRALAGDSALFLQDCRFRASVHWQNPATGEEGEGIAVSLTPDTGMFWFFDPFNIELTLKLLDGRSVNQHWWVFWSHMTSLEVRLKVTDTESGQVVIYTEPAADTAAIPEVCCPIPFAIEATAPTPPRASSPRPVP